MAQKRTFEELDFMYHFDEKNAIKNAVYMRLEYPAV